MESTKSAALDRALLVSIRTAKIKEPEAEGSLDELKQLTGNRGAEDYVEDGHDEFAET